MSVAAVIRAANDRALLTDHAHAGGVRDPDCARCQAERALIDAAIDRLEAQRR